MPLPSVPSTSPTRPIASAVLCRSSAWHQEQKEIGRVASAPSAVSCLHLPRFRASLSSSGQYAGWMERVEHFVAPGPPIGADNTSRYLHWLKPPGTVCLHP